MTRQFIFLFAFLFISIFSYSQLTLTDIEKCTKVSIDEYVEHLLTKSFVVNYRQDKIGTTIDLDYPTLNGDLQFRYSLGYQSTDESWDFIFDKKYKPLFLKLQTSIKNKFTKVKFFYSNNYKHYVTQYKFGEYNIFVGYRPFYNDKMQTTGEDGVIYVTNYYSEFH